MFCGNLIDGALEYILLISSFPGNELFGLDVKMAYTPSKREQKIQRKLTREIFQSINNKALFQLGGEHGRYFN